MWAGCLCGPWLPPGLGADEVVHRAGLRWLGWLEVRGQPVCIRLQLGAGIATETASDALGQTLGIGDFDAEFSEFGCIGRAHVSDTD